MRYIKTKQTDKTNTMNQKQPGVWSGVKIGCGMFIVLPLILLGAFYILSASTCGVINKQKEAIEKQKQIKKNSVSPL